ncbi:nicotinamidase-related amidase [Halarchaeum solikamskense]|uniref:cysteine hydrolase family protein n=1 Tax=Halarchaeum nitratireducens TaxID=489913 RepID=UPI001B3AD0C7|nr:nicotinamidase-related amidase [Halarchaeum solikamskense]
MIPTDGSPIGDTPALLVIDLQQGDPETDEAMVSDAGSVAGGYDAIIEHTNELVAAARDADVPVIWFKELHRPDFADYGAELESCEPPHTLRGSAAERLHPDLDVDADGDDLPPAEYVVEKRRYNCFHRTELEHLLATYDVDTVLLAGTMTNVCVHYTAHGAHEREYAFRAVEECVAAPTAELHEIGLRCMRYLQPRGVRGLDDVTGALADYDGNPVVRRVTETGRVTDDVGAVSADVSR